MRAVPIPIIHIKSKTCDVRFICPNCGKVHYVKNIKISQYNKLFRKDLYIQDIFPKLNERDREKFVTGLCNRCQRYIFGEYYN